MHGFRIQFMWQIQIHTIQFVPISAIRNAVGESFIAIISGPHCWMVLGISSRQILEHGIVRCRTIVTAFLVIAAKPMTI